MLEKFINILAICQTIIVENDNGEISYNASSPDELALTNAARHFGMTFRDRDPDNNAIIYNKFTGLEEKYEVLNIMEFTSARKRMSVVVRTPDGRIMSMIKGADSILLPLLHKGQDALKDKINKDLDEYANEGLKTLILTQKEIDPIFFRQWNTRWEDAMKLKGDEKENMLDKLSKEIENEYELIGCSAIEDKLQDDVGEVIHDIKDAGVKFWVLTGDKPETAINIGFSCQLLDQDMEIFEINEVRTKQIYR